MTQAVRVLKRLRRGPLTAKQAQDELAVGRCAARIKDLRDMGHDIHTEIATVFNRFGEECRIGQYRLIKESSRP